jgi:ABC-type microcin C transport system permease subunit YejB
MVLTCAHRFARYGLVDNGIVEIRKDLEHSKPNYTRYTVILRRDIVVQGDSTMEGIDDIWIHDIEKEFGLTDDLIEQYKQRITDFKEETEK